MQIIPRVKPTASTNLKCVRITYGPVAKQGVSFYIFVQLHQHGNIVIIVAKKTKSLSSRTFLDIMTVHTLSITIGY